MNENIFDKSFLWHDGKGNHALFEDIIEEIENHTVLNGRVYLGCDSQIHGESCIFVTTICIHGGELMGGRYYFRKELLKDYGGITLRQRINEEVSRAVSIFLHLVETIPEIDAEIHIDIGRTARSKTRYFVDSITGWLTGLGASYKIKPDAWAAASVADKHTK